LLLIFGARIFCSDLLLRFIVQICCSYSLFRFVAQICCWDSEICWSDLLLTRLACATLPLPAGDSLLRGVPSLDRDMKRERERERERGRDSERFIFY
jgi:hypothetical protein